MARHQKLLMRVLQGSSDANIPFSKLCQLLEWLEFDVRIHGSHHILTKDGIEEILNLQPKNGNAKAYQVKQVRRVILKYGLAGDING